MQNYFTRIAPSNTGKSHLGLMRTAYFNWLIAKSTNGRFILRIDDTDAARSKDEYTQTVIDTMNWLGLDYDDIYYQSKRMDKYSHYLEILKKRNAIKIDENGATMLSLPDIDLPKHWHDNLAGDIKITNDNIERCNGMVLFRADGAPTYNFASVVDDIDLGINYVVRGVDHITNTAKQVILYTLLDAQSPQYAHVGLIHKDKKPLSKREGMASMAYYIENDYDPNAVLNYMLKLGWNVSDPTMKRN